MKRVFRFIKAVIKYAVTGHFKNVSFDVYVDRLEKCKACGEYNKDKYTCNLCGCYLDKKAKWETEHCMKNNW